MTARRLLAVGWVAALLYLAVQCGLASRRSADDFGAAVGFALFALLFASLAVAGAYYIVVRSGS